MIKLVFHTPPTFSAMRNAMSDLNSLIDEVDEARPDLENDNFYFLIDTDREQGVELKQSLAKLGYNISVKDDVEAYFV